MNKDSCFKQNWKEFMRGNMSDRPPEKVPIEEVARLFFEIGFSKGAMQ